MVGARSLPRCSLAPIGARGAAGHGGTAGVTAASSHPTHAAIIKAVNSLDNEYKLLAAGVAVVAGRNIAFVVHRHDGVGVLGRIFRQEIWPARRLSPGVEVYCWRWCWLPVSSSQFIWGIAALVQSVCWPELDAVAGVWGYGGHHHRNSHTIALVVDDKLFAWTGIYVTYEFH